MSTHVIENEILDFLTKDAFFREFLPNNFNSATNLKKLGVFDSLSLVSMIAFLEKKFSITFEVADITERNFESVGALADYVRQKQIG
jgi:acyl carrier protein